MTDVPPLDALFSFAYHQRTDLQAVRDAMGPDARMMIDSGAFTAHTKGKPIPLAAYRDYLDKWAGVYDHAITLDVIGDPRATVTNTEALWSAGYDVMPVFTVGEEYSMLDSFARDGHTFVCAGGLVGMRKPVVRPYLASVVRYARERGVSIHALGVGGVRLLLETGAYSGDSSAATQAPAFGSVAVWNGRIVNQVRVSDKEGLSRVRDWLSGLDCPFDDMISGRLFGKEHRSSRDRIVEAGLYAFAVGGAYMRSRKPTSSPGLPDGPRLLAACSTDDARSIVKIAAKLRNDPPRSVLRAVRTF